MSLANTIKELRSYRLCALAVPDQKFPPITPSGKWKQYQSQMPSDYDAIWMANNPRTTGLCIIGGHISGGLFIRDFEGKDSNRQPMKCQFEDWLKIAHEAGHQDLLNRCLVITTKNGGYHLYYRVDTPHKLPSTKLAIQGENTLIESRAEGCYALIPPSRGYGIVQGSLTSIPTISQSIHEKLLEIDQAFDDREHTSQHQFNLHKTSFRGNTRESRPGDRYNQKNDFKEILVSHGWTCLNSNADKELWCRPGKDPREGYSATFNAPECPRKFYVFSSNAQPFEEMRSYSPFAILTMLEYDGDFSRAAKTLNFQYRHNNKEEEEEEEEKKEEERRRGHPSPTSTSTSTTSTSELPTIIVNDRFMREINTDIIDAIKQDNRNSPTIFVRSGMPTRIKIDEKNHAAAEPMSIAATRNYFDGIANFVRKSTKVNGDDVQVFFKPTPPTETLAKNYLAEPHYNHLPPLEGVITFPIVTESGEIITNHGYHPESKCYYHPAYPIQIGDTSPANGNLAKAKAFILEDILGGFPFVDQASLANTLAEMITPLVRQIIKGPTPLFSHDAPTPGTGKSLLASVCTLPFSLSGASVMTAGRDDDEWRKRITAKLMTGTSHILIDNVQKKLESGDLAAAITTPINGHWEDRILGQTAIIRLPVRCTWIATGNNLELSNEIARRTVWIRLDAKTERPWKRVGFKHEDLEDWVIAKRGEILTALIVWIKAWIADGKVNGDVTFGGFNAWSKVISGILASIGEKGFMENADELYDTLDTERDAWVHFCEAWAEKYGAWSEHHKSWGHWGEGQWIQRPNPEVLTSVGVKELFEIASHDDDTGKGDDILDMQLARGNARARQNHFGRLLKKNKDRVFGNYQIQMLNIRVKRLIQYRLTTIVHAPKPESSDSKDSSFHEGGESSQNTNTTIVHAPKPESSDSKVLTPHNDNHGATSASNSYLNEVVNNSSLDREGISCTSCTNNESEVSKATSPKETNPGASNYFDTPQPNIVYHDINEIRIQKFISGWEKLIGIEQHENELRELATSCYIDLTITPHGDNCSPVEGIKHLLQWLKHTINSHIIQRATGGWWQIQRRNLND